MGTPGEEQMVIGSRAFKDCSALETITLPDDLTSIEESALENCTTLTEVNIPDGIATIKSNAFKGCTALEEVVLPNSLEVVEDSAFEGCSALTAITVSSFVDLEDTMFVGSNNIERIKYIVGDGYVIVNDFLTTADYNKFGESIAANAFLNNAKLLEVVLPSTVTSLGESAFEGCTALTTFVLSSAITSIPQNAFKGCTALTAIALPQGVTTIGFGAFQGCTHLTEVTTTSASALATIEANAFYGCAALNVFAIPAGVTAINSSVFGGCLALNNIVIPQTITRIASSAFTGAGLATVTFASTTGWLLNSITKSALTTKDVYNSVVGLSNAQTAATYLTDTYKARTWTKFQADSNGFVINSDNAVIGYTGDATQITIPSTATAIEEEAFRNITTITSVAISNGVTIIYKNAFADCSALATVTFGDDCTLETIDEVAFARCTALSNIVLPDSLGLIGRCAFLNCSALTHINIPENVTWIYVEAFSGTGLTTATFAITSGWQTSGTTPIDLASADIANEETAATYLKTTYKSSAFRIVEFVYDSNTLIKYNGKASSLTIPAQATAIGEAAFKGNSYITEIVIPKEVVSIGQSAFEGCENLESVVIEEESEMTTIRSNAFKNCENLEFVQIPGNLTTVDNETIFSGCNKLTEVRIIGERITRTGASALWSAERIESIKIAPSVTIIKSDAMSSVDDDWHIVYFLYLKEIIFEDDSQCTTLEDECFLGHINLVKIDFGNTTAMTTWISDVFYCCFNLYQITIPASLTSWSSGAFSACSRLKEVYNLSSVSASFGSGVTVHTSLDEPSIFTNDNGFVYYEENGKKILHYYDQRDLNAVIPSYIDEIGSQALQFNFYTESITIPSSVTYIGPMAFRESYGLKYLVFEDPTNWYNGSLVDANSLLDSEVNVTTFLEQASYEEFNEVEIPWKKVYTDGDFVLDSDNVVVGYIGNGGEITLPNTATAIGDSVFASNRTITSVVIPNSITSIGQSAFNGCSNLVSVTMGDGVTSIGYRAFYNCTKLCIFSNNTTSNLETIGQQAFYGAALVRFVVTEKVTSIGNGAFEKCYKLYEVYDLTTDRTDPAPLNIVKNQTNGCVAQYAQVLNTDISTESVIKYEGDFGYYETGEDKTLLTYKGSDAVITIPNIITIIGAYAFYNRADLISITIPNSVKTISQYSFSGTSIMSIVLPSSITNNIGTNAFQNCTKLYEVYNFTELANISEGSQNQGCVAYYAQHVYTTTEGNPSKVTIDSNGYGYYDDGTDVILLSYSGSSTALTIPSVITKLCDNLFEGNLNITSVVIPNSIIDLGTKTFFKCRNLASVTFESGCQITEFKESVFDGCTSLTAIEIPASVVTLYIYAFDGCTSLASLTFEADSHLETLGEKAFRYAVFTTITIPKSVQTIDYDCFGHCEKLETVLFEANSNLINLGQYAFYQCKGLKTIQIPKGVTIIKNSTFDWCYELVNLTFEEGSLLTEIQDSAFDSCSHLRNIIIPAGVTTIGNSAFWRCVRLESVTFADGSQLATIGNNVFRECIRLSTITLPATLTQFGAGVFAECSALESIVFADSNNWTYADAADSADWTAANVSDSAANVELLIQTLAGKYFKKSAGD